MEKIIDFDKFIIEQKEVRVEYYAIFEPLTGNLLGVYPANAASDIPNKIKIDMDIALSILNGEVNPQTCKVNLETNKLDILEIINLNRSHQLLYRVSDAEYTNTKDHEVFIEYHRQNKKAIFELSNRYGGSKEDGHKLSKQIFWDGETELVFLFTDYNDPNIVHEIVTVRINELIGKSVVIENISVPERFSIFTRKVFLNYLLTNK